MAHTQPDYSTKYKLVNVFGQLDNAELAARIRPLSMLDRAGHIIWYDDFENATLHWEESNSGAGADCSISTTKAQFGEQSLKMIAGSDTGAYGRVRKRLDYLPTAKIGWEFYCNADTNVDNIALDVNLHNGVRNRRAQLRVDYDSSIIQIRDRYAGFVTIDDDADLSTSESRFHWIKFTVDTATSMYSRLLFKGISYDISAYETQNVDASTNFYMIMLLYNYGDLATNAVGYVDNFIVTMDDV